MNRRQRRTQAIIQGVLYFIISFLIMALCTVNWWPGT